MNNLTIDQNNFTYSSFVESLKQGKYKRIVVMTGAGISVSAGIPDFRSPGTGLYDNLKEYNLPQPEALFQIDYFMKNPEPFYKFSKHFDLTGYNPTPTHFFIKMLQQMGVLMWNLTQNIDNLESKTGMDMSQVIQAHGSYSRVYCAKCKKDADFEQFEDYIRN